MLKYAQKYPLQQYERQEWRELRFCSSSTLPLWSLCRFICPNALILNVPALHSHSVWLDRALVNQIADTLNAAGWPARCRFGWATTNVPRSQPCTLTSWSTHSFWCVHVGCWFGINEQTRYVISTYRTHYMPGYMHTLRISWFWLYCFAPFQDLLHSSQSKYITSTLPSKVKSERNTFSKNRFRVHDAQLLSRMLLDTDLHACDLYAILVPLLSNLFPALAGKRYS